jgi:mono/diheme cytochrome c family protein
MRFLRTAVTRGRPSRRRAGWIGAAAAAIVLVGWGGWAALGAPETSPAAAQGKVVYDQHCAVCHGPTGQADGPGAAGLPIKPPPLTDGTLLNGLSDDLLFTIVSKGAGAVGLAPQMPAFQPPLTDGQIRDVIAYVRSMAKPPYEPPPAAAVVYQAPAPIQPILFNHAIHAGSYRIDCQYCHADARRGVYAGVPSVERCMGCHKIVAAQGNPEVQKLQGYWTRKEPIPWVRIHKVPGFVEFAHKRHIQVGLQCQQCHGPVERMERVAQVAPLTMGWCVSCHAEKKGPLDCVTCHH